MLNLKKTAVAVLAFSSSAVFAGTMGPVCTPGNVTVPCEHTAWDLGARALYLQVNHGGGGEFYGSSTTSGVTRWFDESSKYNWGFMIEGSYHFSTGNDFNINWYHLTNSRRTGTLPSGFVFVNGTSVIGTQSATFRHKWDAVNFEFGQHVDFGEFDNIRFHGGAQYARLNSQFSRVGTGTVAGVATDFSNRDNVTFNGFGPRVGADASYDWGNGLGIYAKGAMAILAGSNSFNANRSVSTTGITTASGSNSHIVPELEAKLGATYTYAMAQGDVILDAGWMFVDYINAHHWVAVNPADTPVVNHDFTLQGPYFGLTWVGNV